MFTTVLLTPKLMATHTLNLSLAIVHSLLPLLRLMVSKLHGVTGKLYAGASKKQ